MGMGLIATTPSEPAQRLAAAVLLQACADARQRRNSLLRAEALMWMRRESDSWLALLCPPGRDLHALHRAYLALAEQG
jgi:hypothetical protein